MRKTEMQLFRGSESTPKNLGILVMVDAMTPLAAETYKDIERIRAEAVVISAKCQADAAIQSSKLQSDSNEKVAKSQFEVPAKQETIRFTTGTVLAIGTLVAISIMACYFVPEDQRWLVLSACAGACVSWLAFREFINRKKR